MVITGWEKYKMKKRKKIEWDNKSEKNLKTEKEKEEIQEKEYLERVKKKIKTMESTYWKYLSPGKGNECSPCPRPYPRFDLSPPRSTVN